MVPVYSLILISQSKFICTLLYRNNPAGANLASNGKGSSKKYGKHILLRIKEYFTLQHFLFVERKPKTRYLFVAFVGTTVFRFLDYLNFRMNQQIKCAFRIYHCYQY